jgi:hypothetical protein
MRLIDWENLLASMSGPDKDPKQTYLQARLRGFEDLDAQVASIYLNCQGDELFYALRSNARDPTYPPYLRALMHMRLGELTQDPGASSEFRTEALKIAQALPYSMDRTLLMAWIENPRFMKGDVPLDMKRYQDNLNWLVPNGQRNAVELALYCIAKLLERDRLDEAQRIISTISFRMASQAAAHTAADVQETSRLRDSIARRRAKLRQPS